MTFANAQPWPGQQLFSFEFFPPKTEQQCVQLDEAVARLAPYRPRYVSVTYGAGGSSQERSVGSVRSMQGHGLTVAAHITCAGASRDEVGAQIAEFRALGVERFVALRGDPAGGPAERYLPHPAGFTDTAELVSALKQSGATDVAVSAYPEKHPHSPDWDSEIAALKRKVDAGADRAITQFFYDNDLFEAYVERVRRAGIAIPIVPGIMPIHRFAAVCSFAARCGASVPPALTRRFDGLDPDGIAHQSTALEFAAEQIADLADRGVQQFHLYTLNRADISESLCRMFAPDAESYQAAAA